MIKNEVKEELSDLGEEKTQSLEESEINEKFEEEKKMMVKFNRIDPPYFPLCWLIY